MTRFLLLALGVSSVVALGVLVDSQSHAPVRHAKEAPAPEDCTIFATGRIEGLTPEIELRPQLAGRIDEIFVTEGQRVEKGQALMRLDDSQYRHQVELATAELALARAGLQRLLDGAHRYERTEAAALYRAKQAELERAQLAWRRISELREVKAVSQQEADNQRTLVDALAAEVEAARAHTRRLEAEARPDEVAIEQARIEGAKARLHLAKVQLDRATLRAPCSGQILKIDVEPGELTGPDVARSAVIMADTCRFQVRAFIEEMDAPRVRVGMAAKITADGLPGRELEGRVVRLSPRMGNKRLWSDRPDERLDTKTRQVWIALEGKETLVVGLPVDVTLATDSGPARADSGPTPATPVQKSIPN